MVLWMSSGVVTYSQVVGTRPPFWGLRRGARHCAGPRPTLKPMSARPRRTGSAFLGILGILVVAGLMLTAGVAPAIALSSGTGSGPFALSSDLKIAKLQQKTEIYAKKHGKDVLLASFYVQNRDVITWDQVPRP